MGIYTTDLLTTCEILGCVSVLVSSYVKAQRKWDSCSHCVEVDVLRLCSVIHSTSCSLLDIVCARYVVLKYVLN